MGLTLQPDLVNSVIRFRQYKVSFCTAIEKMYRLQCSFTPIIDIFNISSRKLINMIPSSTKYLILSHMGQYHVLLINKVFGGLINSLQNVNDNAGATIRSNFFMDDLVQK